MIDLLQSRSSTERSLWSGTVQKRIQSLALEDRPVASDVSSSVSMFCQEHPMVPDDALSLLMARSFYVSGDAEAAERILRHDHCCGRHLATWLDVLSVEYPFPELYPLFSAHVLRPLLLSSAGVHEAWILDLDQLALSDADRHELLLFQTLRTLTEKVSRVWNKSDGLGTLGIKGLQRMVVAPGARKGQSAAALFNHMNDVLKQCARTYGWPKAPSVLKIDL